MKILASLLFVSALACSGCKGESKPDSTPPAAAPPATTSAAHATPGAHSAPPPATPPAPAGGAGVFAGEPDATVKLGAAATTKLANLWMQPPAGWSFITDPGLGWQLASPNNRAQLYLDEVPSGGTLAVPADGVVPGYSLKNTKMGAVEKSTLGKFSLPVQVSSGTSHIGGQNADGKVYAFQIQTGDKKDVHGIALLRSGASADEEKALVASIRSIRRANDK